MGLLSYLLTPIGPSAATPNNPRFGLNDPDAWDNFLGGGSDSPAGISVGREQALAYGPWWRGINLLANDVAKLPLHVYQRTDDGKEKAVEHPAYYLLARKPNEYQTSFDFKRQMMGHMLSMGNAYAYIQRNGAGMPVELLPLDPDSTYPARERGTLFYVNHADGQMTKLPAEDVLHFKGFGFDGLQGYSVVEKARAELGLALAADYYAAVFFRNGAGGRVVLSSPQRVDDKVINQIRNSWDRMYAGLDNAHRTAVLQQGLEAKLISFSARDSQLIESRQFNPRMVALWLGVPPHKLGADIATSYGSLEQENTSYVNESLDPHLCNLEETCGDKLLTEEEKRSDTHHVCFDRRRLVRADASARGAYYSAALAGTPWMTPNEVREDEGMEPAEEGDYLPNTGESGTGEGKTGEQFDQGRYGREGQQSP